MGFVADVGERAVERRAEPFVRIDDEAVSAFDAVEHVGLLAEILGPDAGGALDAFCEPKRE